MVLYGEEFTITPVAISKYYTITLIFFPFFFLFACYCQLMISFFLSLFLHFFYLFV